MNKGDGKCNKQITIKLSHVILHFWPSLVEVLVDEKASKSCQTEKSCKKSTELLHFIESTA